MNRKPFQEATVRCALEALAAPGGSRRFLVADEVGLGKTRVAQGVLEKMSAGNKHLEVFYVCSSLSIIHQNRDALLDFLEPGLAKEAKVAVDRLTLLPTRRVSKNAPLTLYTLTPGTLPGGRRTGRADERAVIWHLLCAAIDGLYRHGTLAEVFRRNVSSWDDDLERAREYSYGGVESEFRRKLAVAIGLSEAAWSDTLIEQMKEIAQRDSPELVSCARAALARAGLELLSPDLIIFDEFQRFFEILVPGEDDDPVARQLIELLLREHDPRGPSVLLLSATPYRPFSSWVEGAEEHYDQFFKLLGFLFGRREARNEVAALTKDLREYRDRLQRDPIGSTQIVQVRDQIVERLGRVMSRVERPRRIVDRQHFERFAASLEPIDIRVFRHLSDCVTRREDRPAVTPYWMSIPYPLQMMDQGYMLAKHADPQPLPAESRKACILWKQVRRYEPVSHPHPKLRRLLNRVSAKTLALPWMPPTLPWWPLEGVFSHVYSEQEPSSKTLLFSRFRAVPRSVASVLSYEAERYCFSPESQRARGVKPVAYEYRTEPGQRPASGLRKRPTRSFVFPIAAKQETSMRSLSMFVPAPELAALGDPLTIIGRDRRASLESVLRIVAQRIASRLGKLAANPRPQGTWPWAAELERRGDSWSQYSEGLLAALAGDARANKADVPEEEGSRGVERAAISFLNAPPTDRLPSNRELLELAEVALLAPGNILFRAVSRVFGKAASLADRIKLITRASVFALRPYLDQPDFHLLLRQRHRRQHPEAIRLAVWHGCLESVLDEYLSILRGLGVDSVPTDIEERSLASLTRALSVGVATITVQETGKEVSNETFRLRCHAALPFGLGRQETSDEQGAFHYDDLRMAFNSPFRPHLLATTSIGQEGLDFHGWCNHVVHWDLPSNPVALEQRDGRVDRYAGLAVRRALAEKAQALPQQGSPWGSIAESQHQSANGLSPWWICGDARIQRTVLIPSLSSMEDDLDELLDKLSLYRMALGQVDQEALVHALRRRLADAGSERDAALAWLDKARIDLSPIARNQR